MSQLLHLCLLDIKQTKPKHEGICVSATRIAMYRMALSGKGRGEAIAMTRELTDLIEEWPKSKSAAYPVEGDSHCFDQDKSNGILWNNPRRIELLDWLIERTKDHDTRTDVTDSGS